MVTPLFKGLKENGTSFYVFPGAAEDISASHQNQNYKMYFSKYVLINMPKQNLVDLGGTQSEYKKFDFGTFSTVSPTQPNNFSDQVIESLRNYVANHEVTIRGSRLNNTEFYYDPTALETTSEKIFFKWCKKLGIISLEPSIPQDEYFDNLNEFERKNLNDDAYFKEYLWKERETSQYSVSNIDTTGNLELTLDGMSNIRTGDILELTNILDSSLISEIGDLPRIRVLSTSIDINDNHVITLDISISFGTYSSTGLKVNVYYQTLVKYIGEVNGVSNVQQANKSYSEVYAHVPDHTGKTPDILFRTIDDQNYKPGLIFPIRPNQYQPEIIGAELFSSPIVNTPLSYPGSYYGQFDTPDFTYEVSNGDSIRRSGDFYGVSGDINTPIVDGNTIDGITIDFNTDHYVKMNIEDRTISTFDQFNALEVNNSPPEDFDFNAILWYYIVEDINGNKRTNLYGITFLDNPENNPIPSEVGIKFPSYKKLVSNGTQDGTAYAFALNLNWNIISDNVIESYNPDAVNSMFSMNLFNKAMSKLGSINDSFLNVISEQKTLSDEIGNVRQLLYSQADFNSINSRLSNLDNLLRLYSSNQMISSDTIEVELITEVSPPVIKQNNIDRGYSSIETYYTGAMYSSIGSIPIQINTPKFKDFMIKIVNNDEVSFDLDENLKILITSDLSFRQSLDIVISGTDISSQNKKLDIYLTTTNPLDGQIPNDETVEGEIISGTPVETLIIGDIDLPIFYNLQTSQQNSAKSWSNFQFGIDFNQDIIILPDNNLQLNLDGNQYIVSNSIKEGDYLVINNLFVGTTSVFDFSGQYMVSDVGTGSQITLDTNINEDLVSYATGQLPMTIHGASSSLLSNVPFLSINKGQWIRITRTNELDQIPINEKYLIDIRNIDY